MTDIRPGFTIARCCRNCHYYRFHKYTKAHPIRRADGRCLLSLVIDKKANPLKTHSTAVCDAHIWKPNRKALHKIIVEINATPPEGTV